MENPRLRAELLQGVGPAFLGRRGLRTPAGPLFGVVSGVVMDYCTPVATRNSIRLERSFALPLILFLTLAGLFYAPLSSGAGPADCADCKNAGRFARLQSPLGLPQGAKVRFSHPLDLKPEQWVAILSSIRVQSESGFLPFFTAKSSPTPAFNPDEISYLGAALSKNFAQAQPDKWTTFYLSRSRSPEVTEVVTGAWFVGGTRLHLLLANYRQAVTLPNILGRLRKDPLFVNVPPVYALVPGKHQTLEEKRGHLGRILKSEVQDLSIDYNSMLTGKPDAPVERSATPDAPAPPAVSPVEERLRTLQRLKDDGLITEKEYQEKRKDILKDL